MKNKYIHKELIYPNEKISRYFAPLEWRYLPYIDSLFFLTAYFKGKDFGINERDLKIYCLNNLQNIFCRILGYFLESRFDKCYQSSIKEKMNKYLIFRNVFLNNPYSANPEPVFDLDNQSQLIIDLYQDLNQLKKKIVDQLDLRESSLNIKKQFDANCLRESAWQYKTIHFLQKKVSQELNSLVISCFIHGSFATEDFLENWSDLDTVFILNNKIFDKIDYLNRARRKLRKLSLLCDKIDPISHHRFFFLTQFDLSYYPSFVFPPVIADYAMLLVGQKEIKINLRPDKYEKIQIMSNFVNYFRDKILNQKYSQDQIHWKNDLAHVMLWPTFMLQAKGISVYKKHSFERVKKEFPEIDFKIVDRATILMENWSRTNLLRYYPNSLFALLPFRLNQIIINQQRRYLNRRIKQSFREIKQFTQKSLIFLEQSMELVLNKIKNE